MERGQSCSAFGPYKGSCEQRYGRAGAVLGWHLRESGLTPDAVRNFNAERAPRVRDVLTKARC